MPIFMGHHPSVGAPPWTRAGRGRGRAWGCSTARPASHPGPPPVQRCAGRPPEGAPPGRPAWGGGPALLARRPGIATLRERPRASPTMNRRSRAREVALQLLYQRDLNPRVERDTVERFVRDRLRDPAVEPFALGLYDGVVTHAADIDRRLGEAATNWRLPRMAAVDRNVLRLGAFELLHAPQT